MYIGTRHRDDKTIRFIISQKPNPSKVKADIS